MVLRAVFAAVLIMSVLAGPRHVGAFDLGASAYVEVPEDYLSACNHYQNRARFLPRIPPLALEVRLADSCAEALRRIAVRIDTTPYVAVRARAYLDALVRFKATIIEMNVTRVFGANPAPRAMPRTVKGPFSQAYAPRSNKVTGAGEYLIAREMGLIRAHDALAGAVGQQRIAVRHR